MQMGIKEKVCRVDHAVNGTEDHEKIKNELDDQIRNISEQIKNAKKKKKIK